MSVTSQGLTAAEQGKYASIMKKFKDAGKEKALQKVQSGLVEGVIDLNGSVETAIAGEVRAQILQANGGRGLDPADFPPDP
jgi:regulator of RNase E activity RraA